MALTQTENNAKMFTSYGGELLSNISDLVNKSDVIILSLPTVPIFKTVIDEIEKNGAVIHPKILIDMNTISLDDKLRNQR
jgi:3-hydroxyisobutyrate dehydrogenase-like beta-hydroxyacid dehydrogenase